MTDLPTLLIMDDPDSYLYPLTHNGLPPTVRIDGPRRPLRAGDRVTLQTPCQQCDEASAADDLDAMQACDCGYGFRPFATATVAEAKRVDIYPEPNCWAVTVTDVEALT